MSETLKGMQKSMASMEQDFCGAKGDRKRKVTNKLAPKIQGLRQAARIKAYQGR